MKRSRQSAVVVSSDSENNNDEGDSDYDIKPDKPSKRVKKSSPKPKKAVKTTKETKSLKRVDDRGDCKTSKIKTSQSSKGNRNGISSETCKVSKTSKIADNDKVKTAQENVNDSLNDSLYDSDPSWTPADVISRDLNLDWSVTNTTCELLEAGNSLPFLARYCPPITAQYILSDQSQLIIHSVADQTNHR